MSYKTNPIANRLNINKGFLNTSFLNNKTAYSQILILWLSLYLFLKSYLAFKKIKLLTCEIRIMSITQKILYVSFIKIPKAKPNKKRIWRRYSIKSQLNKVFNKKSIYLIYQRSQIIKKLINIQKKNPKNNFKFYYKTINKVFNRYNKRKILNLLKNKKNDNLFVKNNSVKTFLWITPLIVIYLKKFHVRIKNIKHYSQILKKITLLLSTNESFKNIYLHLWLLYKLQKLNKNKEKFFFSKSLQFKKKRIVFQTLKTKKLKNRLKKSSFFLIQFKGRKNRYLGKKKKYFLSGQSYKKWKLLLRDKLYWHYVLFNKQQNWNLLKIFFLKKRNKYINFYFQLIRKLLIRSYRQRHFRLKILRSYYLRSLSKFKKKVTYLNIIKRNKKNIYMKKKQFLKKKKDLLLNNKKQKKLFKTIKFIKQKKPYLWLKWKKKLLLLQKKQKKNFIVSLKINKIRRIKKIKKKQKKNKNLVQKKYSKVFKNKRYIKKYLKNQYLKNKIKITAFNLQSILEGLISKFFKVTFNIKFINTFVLFKNKKTFISIFKTHRKDKKKKEKNIAVYNVNFHNKIIHNYSKNFKWNILKIHNDLKIKYNENKAQKQENLDFGKKYKILGKFFPFLVLYQKYLNAQLLAEQMSKLIKKKKKHRVIFDIIYSLLKVFKLNNIISYRISIDGKMDSKARAQKFYITRGHIPNQSFLKRINYGLAQAKTPTGTFGIRVWIYF